MWKIVILVLVVLVVGVLVIASMRPNDFSVQRSVSIQAPPEKIFSMIDDFRQWPAWSPWEKLDPTMKRTLSGAASGWRSGASSSSPLSGFSSSSAPPAASGTFSSTMGSNAATSSARSVPLSSASLLLSVA